MVTKEKEGKVKKEKKASDKAIEAAADAKKNTPMGRMIAESVMPPSVGDIWGRGPGHHHREIGGLY